MGFILKSRVSTTKENYLFFFFLIWSPLLLCLMYSLLLGFLVNLQDLSYMPLIWVSEFPSGLTSFLTLFVSYCATCSSVWPSHFYIKKLLFHLKVVFPGLRLFLFHECCLLKFLLRIWFNILQTSLSCRKVFLKELSSLEIMNIFSIFKCFSVFSSLWGSAVCPV